MVIQFTIFNMLMAEFSQFLFSETLRSSQDNKSTNRDGFDEFHRSSRSKRAQANGQPFDLYVEVLVVTDYSIYQDNIEYAQTSDVNLVFLYMKTYFAHYINGVILPLIFSFVFHTLINENIELG